jgi:hypothetical protein
MNNKQVLQYIEGLLAALEKNRLLTVTVGYEFLEEWSKSSKHVFSVPSGTSHTC